ncbi:MAG TPA: K(+)-transporting ATPase subunit F [Steroidobacteraceae bacterium]|nr:K(+)-transporting ATPase subunit F [Steroidobacteraceae bacterium]
MTLIGVAALVLVVGLALYLVVALLAPEKFQ